VSCHTSLEININRHGKFNKDDGKGCFLPYSAIVFWPAMRLKRQLVPGFVLLLIFFKRFLFCCHSLLRKNFVETNYVGTSLVGTNLVGTYSSGTNFVGINLPRDKFGWDEFGWNKFGWDVFGWDEFCWDEFAAGQILLGTKLVEPNFVVTNNPPVQISHCKIENNITCTQLYINC